MLTPDMLMQIRPTQASDIAITGWAIVSQKKDRIFHNISILVPDTDVLVCARDVRVFEVFVQFCGIICKYHIVRNSLDSC